MNLKNYPEYASIEKHIRAARIERAPVIAHAISNVVIGIWDAIKAPPSRPAVMIDRRIESRIGARLASR